MVVVGAVLAGFAAIVIAQGWLGIVEGLGSSTRAC